MARLPRFYLPGQLLPKKALPCSNLRKELGILKRPLLISWRFH